jgi:integrase
MLAKRNKTWHFVIWFNGRRYRRSCKTSKESEAKKVESLVLARLMEDGKLPGSKKVPTLAEFASRFFAWLDSLPADRTPKGPTRRYYRVGWKMLQRTSIARRQIDRITSDHAAGLGIGSSPANTNNALRTLRRVLSKAHEWGVIGAAPVIKMVEEQGREQVIEAWMEQKILLLGLQPLSDVLLIMLDTGMRPAEVFRMRWEHVHWERDVVFVPRSKSKKSKRFVGMTSRARSALLRRGRDCGEYRTGLCQRNNANRERNLVSAGGVVRSLDNSTATTALEGWVFPSPRALSGHIETVQKQFDKAKRLAEIPESIVLYCARHRFSTDAMQGTGNSFAVADAMGHSRIETTRIYQHPGTKQVRDAIEKRNLLVQ